MKKTHLFATLFSCAAILLCANSAHAQLGPDLRPPGLEQGHPVNSYTPEGKNDGFGMMNGWDLSANEVVFSAAKKRQLISEAPSTIHVITAREIKAHGWRTLAEILRHVPGIQTQTTQSQFQSVMIRGLVGTENNNSRILWLQNGIPLNDVRDSGIWLDDTYPVEMIKRIEVVLGPGSALYGSGAFQGVVNIFTKDPADINPYGEYRVAMGDDLTFKASAIAAYESENSDFGILGHVAGNYTQGPGLVGDYVYTHYLMDQASASVSNSNDPTYGRYESIVTGSDKYWINVNLKLHYKGLKLNLGYNHVDHAGSDGSEIVSNIFTDQEDYANVGEGLNTEALKNTTFTKFNRQEFYTDLIYENAFTDSLSFLGVFSYRLMKYQYENQAAFDANTEQHFDGKHQSPNNDSQNQGLQTFNTWQHKLYGLAQLQWQIYEANELIAGVGLESHIINSPEFLNGRSDYVFDGIEGNINPYTRATDLSYLSASVFLQDEQRFWNDRIILTAGARFDAYRVTDRNPDLAPSWRVAFLGKWTDWMTMRLSYGHAFKAPSLYQHYIDNLDNINNPVLKPEELENVELAFLFTPTYNLKIRFDSFFTYMTDLIIMRYDEKYADPYIGKAGRYVAEQNMDAIITGFELSLDSALTENWHLYGHFNLLFSMPWGEEKEGKEIPDDAHYRLALGASYMNRYLTADLAMFMIMGTDKTKSAFSWRDPYAVPFYAILQPQVTVALPANLGLMFQASFAFSEGMDKSPTWKYYYEKEGIPVDRYTGMISLVYPYQ